MIAFTYTSSHNEMGAHSRHKEMARALIRAGYQVYWLGPYGSDAAAIEGIRFLPLQALLLQRVWVFGYLLFFCFNFLYYLTEIRSVNTVFVIREKEAIFFPFLRVCGVCAEFSLFQRANVIDKLRFLVCSEREFLKKMKSRLRLGFWHVALKILYRLPDKVIVQTPRHQLEICQSFRTRTRPLVIPNSVSASWFSMKPLDIREGYALVGEKLIGFVGNLYFFSKGLDLLVDAFLSASGRDHLGVVVIGDGPEKYLLENEIAAHRLESRFSLLGRLPDASRLVGSFDVLMHLSRVDDCPNVVLEGLAANVPIVATRIAAHEFILGEDFCGLAEVDAQSIAKVLEMALFDEAFRDVMLKQQAIRLKLFSFDWDAEIVNGLQRNAI